MGLGTRLLRRLFLAALQALIFVHVNNERRSNPITLVPWCIEGSLEVDCHSKQNLHHESDNVTRLKVILPAFGQTGTTSVMDALRELGIRGYHTDDYSLVAKPVMIDEVPDSVWVRTVTRCRMDAISLEPTTDLLPLAMRVSPEAKVIFTWRDFPGWKKSTDEGGGSKDHRFGYVMESLNSANKVIHWGYRFDRMTGFLENYRREGNPLRFPPTVAGYMYRSLCPGYGWLWNNIYDRGSFKAMAGEEAYLGLANEVYQLVPPERLLVFDVRKHGIQDIASFLGVTDLPKNVPIPRSRSAASRTNDPFFSNHFDIGAFVSLIAASMHVANYLIVAACFRGSIFILWLALSAVRAKFREIERWGRKPQLRRWARAMEQMPIIARLGGAEPSGVLQIAEPLVEAGIRIIEVPLNLPKALSSIKRLVDGLPGNVVVGAGEVIREEQVAAVAGAGGQLIVSPNTSARVIKKSIEMGLISVPGVATPTEALAALECGADALSAFPAELIPPKTFKALRAVLPEDTRVLATGGTTRETMKEYWDAGARGFGIGAGLYTPGDKPDTVWKKAKAVLAACPHSQSK